MIVADTNLIAYFLIPGKHTADARRVFLKDPDWVAPAAMEKRIPECRRHLFKVILSAFPYLAVHIRKFTPD